eukprot:XP_022263954.1 uncharacterized protein LOC102156997 isoform X4 [Canis lupus familiaris]
MKTIIEQFPYVAQQFLCCLYFDTATMSPPKVASDLYAWSDDFYLFMTPKLWRYPLRPQQESRAQRRLPSDGDTEGRKRTQADNQPWRKGRGSWDQPAGGAGTFKMLQALDSLKVSGFEFGGFFPKLSKRRKKKL